jgi:hypothetical protein
MSSTKQRVIISCERSLADWRNNINKYALCRCRDNWEYIKNIVAYSDEEAEKYKRVINTATGERDIHIVRCGHVWYGVK